jgi:release factor glutamine methyltransferase
LISTDPIINIQKALTQASQQLADHSDTPLLDAEILLSFVLAKPRVYLRTWPEQSLTENQTGHFWTAIQQRQHGHPIAYLIGEREFWSRGFTVTPAVLIPRPDTETLVEQALARIPLHQPYKVIDLGTGSGIIAITLAAERPLAAVSATDLSQAALDIAKHNAKRHNTDIQFYHSDWFSQVPPGLFDLIISNPPYIAMDDPHLQRGDLRFEPDMALACADNGLAAIHTIASQSRSRLQPNGHLLLEHGYNQHTAVQSLLQQLGYTAIASYTDLAGQPRVTVGL